MESETIEPVRLKAKPRKKVDTKRRMCTKTRDTVQWTPLIAPPPEMAEIMRMMEKFTQIREEVKNIHDEMGKMRESVREQVHETDPHGGAIHTSQPTI